jgi:hypothetical protein
VVRLGVPIEWLPDIKFVRQCLDCGERLDGEAEANEEGRELPLFDDEIYEAGFNKAIRGWGSYKLMAAQGADLSLIEGR